ncbi:MAG: S41 family peptidase [Candidatus Eremiobacteraeota bacterium]|nr:S41 family peptidase [Candidatus Eremiobacteraeota bacterium]
MPSMSFGTRCLSALVVLIVCLAAAPASALSPQLAADVQQSYRLLISSAYRPVTPQVLLAAASDALADEARKQGVTITPPVLHAQADVEATVSDLDAAIAATAAASHGAATDFAYAAIAAMTRSVGDRYTQFFTPDEFKQFNEALDPERISGIGVMIEPDATTGDIRLTYVVPGTPADRAGLRVGDVLTAIDSTPTKGMSVDAASKLLRGRPGTVVAVSVMRSGSADVAYTIRREQVQPPTVVFKMLPGGIGYVYVMAFGKATPGEFDTAIERLKDQDAKGIILDLRNDGGGYVDSALLISRRFIANKALLTVEERGDRATTIDAANEISVALPVTVLVNQYTASASEITAGALQDDGVGTLVGVKTFGKGVMQTLTPLPDGAAIKITTAHYLTPRRHDINLRGIEPDLRVDENKEARLGDLDRDAQLRAALAFLQKKIAEAKP